MGQSLVQNYIHIVFSTKYRQPLIIPSVEKELHNYLGGICNNLECQPPYCGRLCGSYSHSLQTIQEASTNETRGRIKSSFIQMDKDKRREA